MPSKLVTPDILQSPFSFLNTGISVAKLFARYRLGIWAEAGAKLHQLTMEACMEKFPQVLGQTGDKEGQTRSLSF